jgi:uncharacterized protein YceK
MISKICRMSGMFPRKAHNRVMGGNKSITNRLNIAPTFMRYFLCAALLFIQSGCATYSAHNPDLERYDVVQYPGYYAGVKIDTQLILFPFICENANCQAALLWPIFGSLALLDLPLSLVADTSMLYKQRSDREKLGIPGGSMWRRTAVFYENKDYVSFFESMDDFESFIDAALEKENPLAHEWRPLGQILKMHGFFCKATGSKKYARECTRIVDENGQRQTQTVNVLRGESGGISMSDEYVAELDTQYLPGN